MFTDGIQSTQIFYSKLDSLIDINVINKRVKNLVSTGTLKITFWA